MGSPAASIISVLSGPISRETLYFKELRLESGYDGDSQRRIDLFMLKTYPSLDYEATVYEVKISRGNFLSDIKNPEKQEGARAFCDFFYYATPPGLVKPEEVPEWAGLIYVDLEAAAERRWRKAVRTVVKAPKNDKRNPDWGFLVAATRNCSGWTAEFQAAPKLAALRNKIGGLEWEISQLKQSSPHKAKPE